MNKEDQDLKERGHFRDDFVIINSLSKILFILLFIFGLYIHIHGDIRPGGGFQSGIIFSLSLILHDMLQYYDKYQNLFLERIKFHYFLLTGLLIFFGLIFAPIISHVEPFNYQIFKINKVLNNQLGVFLFESAVSLLVFSSFSIIFRSIFNVLKKSNILH